MLQAINLEEEGLKPYQEKFTRKNYYCWQKDQKVFSYSKLLQLLEMKVVFTAVE